MQSWLTWRRIKVSREKTATLLALEFRVGLMARRRGERLGGGTVGWGELIVNSAAEQLPLWLRALFSSAGELDAGVRRMRVGKTDVKEAVPASLSTKSQSEAAAPTTYRCQVEPSM